MVNKTANPLPQIATLNCQNISFGVETYFGKKKKKKCVSEKCFFS